MAETYFPFDAGAGSSVTEAQWSKMARLWRDDGVIPGLMNELEVTANASGMQVFVDTGSAWLRGFYYENSASLTLPLDAASVSDRIDRIVLRLDTTGNTIHAHVTKGTPAGSPVAPALQAGPTLWDLPLATVFVDSAAVTIGSGNVTDGRLFATIDADTLDGHDTSYFLAAAALTKAAIDALNVDADTLDGHDTSYFLAAAALTKAAIDALNVDADTLDGHDTSFFATDAALDAEVTNRTSADSAHVAAGDPHTGYQLESAHTKALHDGLNIDADTLDAISSAGFVQCPAVQYKTKQIYSGLTTFDGSGVMTLAHGLGAGNVIAMISARWFDGVGFHQIGSDSTATGGGIGWDDGNLYINAGTAAASGHTTSVLIIYEA